MNYNNLLHRSVPQGFLVVCLAALWVVTLDLLTNRVEAVTGHAWDFVYYIDIAENGLIGNDHLAVPYAYRALTPLLARFIALIIGLSTATGFKVLAYISVIGQLFGIYLLARNLQFRFSTALVVTILPAFALFNIKFLLFDSYRPDLLAYPALAFGLICLLKGWLVPAVAIAAVGVQVRETPGILALIAIYELIQQWRADRKQIKPLLWVGLILLVMGLAIGIPRALIPVKFTQQILDPFQDPNFLNVLFGMALNWKRDINLVFNILAYLLPLWLLFTPASFMRAWNGLGRLKAWLVIYMVVIFFMTLYGGTDMMRYVTYLFIPQVILVARMLEQENLAPEQILFSLMAIFIFNRLFLPFPIWDFNAYLDFYGGYGDRLTLASWMRLAELIGWVFAGILLRWWLTPGDFKRIWKN